MRLNKKPYVSMVEQSDYEGLMVYSDSVPHVGTWEYRVLAHDAFGELTPPSPVHTAYARDIQPPLAPQLKYVVLERPDDSDPMSRVLAHVVWEIYYKVRAVDWSNNIGLWSPAIEVKRPHNTPPTAPHRDESWHNDLKGMHTRWIVGTDADMEYHLLLRRLGTEGEWQVLARWDADSIAATGSYAVEVDDNPPYDQEQRYYYMVESHNSTPYTAQSLAVSWLHQGPRVLDGRVYFQQAFRPYRHGMEGHRHTLRRRGGACHRRAWSGPLWQDPLPADTAADIWRHTRRDGTLRAAGRR